VRNDIHADRQTDRRHTHHNTLLPYVTWSDKPFWIISGQWPRFFAQFYIYALGKTLLPFSYANSQKTCENKPIAHCKGLKVTTACKTSNHGNQQCLHLRVGSGVGLWGSMTFDLCEACCETCNPLTEWEHAGKAGYLSRATSRWSAYGPANSTATHPVISCFVEILNC